MDLEEQPKKKIINISSDETTEKQLKELKEYYKFSTRSKLIKSLIIKAYTQITQEKNQENNEAITP